MPSGHQPPPDHEADPGAADLFDREITSAIEESGKLDFETAAQIVASSRRRAERETDRATYQAMEGFVHNLNTMHSRAGAQTPFSSINYGTDTSPEGRMAIRNVLLATDAALARGDRDLSDPYLQGQGGGSTTTRGIPTTTCSS